MGLVRKGECKQCGNCCRSVILALGAYEDAPPEEKERGEDFLRWAAAHQGIKVKTVEGFSELRFEAPCSFLRVVDGKHVCADYENRFTICRLFPENPTPNCPGFWFEEVPDEQV